MAELKDKGFRVFQLSPGERTRPEIWDAEK
jgi:hypothetical protein